MQCRVTRCRGERTFAFDRRYFNNGWGRVQSSLWHFMRVQTQFINLVDVEILPPYMPSEQEKQSPRLYADNVRR